METVETEPLLFGINMYKYLFLDVNGKVVNVIRGNHDSNTIKMFLNDFSVLFNAVDVKTVGEDSPVWINWVFDGESFIKPLEEVAE